MAELFDLLNPDGSKTGSTKERDLVHRDGDLHGSVHIWIIKNNKVLLQKRSLHKDSFPGCYDVASSGHVDLSEDFITAAIREVKEELGISIKTDDLYPILTQHLHVATIFNNTPFLSNEINQVFLLKNSVSLSKLTPQKSEIDELKWMELTHFNQEILTNPEAYCIPQDEYLQIMDFIHSNHIN